MTSSCVISCCWRILKKAPTATFFFKIEHTLIKRNSFRFKRYIWCLCHTIEIITALHQHLDGSVDWFGKSSPCSAYRADMLSYSTTAGWFSVFDWNYLEWRYRQQQRLTVCLMKPKSSSFTKYKASLTCIVTTKKLPWNHTAAHRPYTETEGAQTKWFRLKQTSGTVSK